jgi:MYXO-CTERM domain-containing protein
VASGQAFHYQYDTSMQTLTVVPEPSSIALAALGLAALGVAATARRRMFA